MIDWQKSISISETAIRLDEKAIQTQTLFKDFDMFQQFDSVSSDLDKHYYYFPTPIFRYKHELNYPKASIERLEENYNIIYKLIMLKYA